MFLKFGLKCKTKQKRFSKAENFAFKLGSLEILQKSDPMDIPGVRFSAWTYPVNDGKIPIKQKKNEKSRNIPKKLEKTRVDFFLFSEICQN